MFFKSVVLSVLSTLFLGCATGHCPPRYTANQAVTPVTATDVADPFGEGEGKKPTSKQRTPTVYVFKYDGSKYCESAKGISVEKMLTELKGIHVTTQRKLHDGLMRTQVCGQETGYANVYEIPAKDLERALQRGFQQWTFN